MQMKMNNKLVGEEGREVETDSVPIKLGQENLLTLHKVSAVIFHEVYVIFFLFINTCKICMISH